MYTAEVINDSADYPHDGAAALQSEIVQGIYELLLWARGNTPFIGRAVLHMLSKRTPILSILTAHQLYRKHCKLIEMLSWQVVSAYKLVQIKQPPITSRVTRKWAMDSYLHSLNIVAHLIIMMMIGVKKHLAVLFPFYRF